MPVMYSEADNNRCPSTWGMHPPVPPMSNPDYVGEDYYRYVMKYP